MKKRPGGEWAPQAEQPTFVGRPSFALETRVPENETLRMGARPAGLTVKRFRLSGGDGKPFTSTAQRTQLGSHEANEVRLNDPTVSRFHCEIIIDGEQVLIRDLGSTNGTRVNGTRVVQAFLESGAVLGLGAATLRFELEGGHNHLSLSEKNRFGSLVGNSAAQRGAFTLLEKAARSEATVLLEGETGTGKTRAAMAVHEASNRAGKPFLVVDCGAMPAALLEAELFGHEKGAFTGALQRRIGVFEEANGGTVLLDEVGELPLELQPKLLRVLEERLVRRVGQNGWSPVDVRILAATHRDLRTNVNSGRFRADLFFRLAVVRVTMPSLREHAEDIPAIAEELLRGLGATPKTHPVLFAPDFFAGLKQSSWPGNVRELRNYLERCLVFDGPAPTDAEPFAASSNTMMMSGPLTDARDLAIASFERSYLTQLLARHQGRVAEAAAEAEVDRAYLYRLIRKYQLQK